MDTQELLMLIIEEGEWQVFVQKFLTYELSDVSNPKDIVNRE